MKALGRMNIPNSANLMEKMQQFNELFAQQKRVIFALDKTEPEDAITLADSITALQTLFNETKLAHGSFTSVNKAADERLPAIASVMGKCETFIDNAAIASDKMQDAFLESEKKSISFFGRAVKQLRAMDDEFSLPLKTLPELIRQTLKNKGIPLHFMYKETIMEENQPVDHFHLVAPDNSIKKSLNDKIHQQAHSEILNETFDVNSEQNLLHTHNKSTQNEFSFH